MKRYIKNIMKYATAVLATVTICGCTNLDEKPYTFIDPGSFYKNETQLEDGLASVYNQFRNTFGNYKYYMKLECYTDMAQPCYTKENCPDINSWFDVNNASASWGFSNTWAKAFTIINRANTVLGRGEGVSMDATAKAQIYAQARFLRAYAYYCLVRLYGGVPIPESFTEGLTGLEIPRKSVSEVYDYIIADLEYCDQNLPVRGTSGYDVWRASKGAADALLGELYLTRYSMEGNADFLTKSKEYNEKVLDSGVYSLLPDYKNVWLMFNKNAKNNAESIFEIQFAAISGQDNACHRQFGLGNSITVPGYGSYFYHRSGPSHMLYESFNPSDTRRSVLITEYDYNNVHRVFHTSELGFYPGKADKWLTSCPGNAKYYDPWTDASLMLPNTNLYMLRYSEVMLNEAEVLNLLGTNSNKGQNALYYLNQVHQRAGLPAITTTDKTALDDSIFQERCWEFYGEGKIYYDELRTNRLGDRVEKFVNSGVNKGMYQFKELNFKPKKTFLWKIPQTDLDSNPALEQNPDNVSDALDKTNLPK
jgi:hypothetical protein